MEERVTKGFNALNGLSCFVEHRTLWVGEYLIVLLQCLEWPFVFLPRFTLQVIDPAYWVSMP